MSSIVYVPGGMVSTTETLERKLVGKVEPSAVILPAPALSTALDETCDAANKAVGGSARDTLTKPPGDTPA